jgi:hypothetical protein
LAQSQAAKSKEYFLTEGDEGNEEEKRKKKAHMD